MVQNDTGEDKTTEYVESDSTLKIFPTLKNYELLLDNVKSIDHIVLILKTLHMTLHYTEEDIRPLLEANLAKEM